jgi:hypothetical protein
LAFSLEPGSGGGYGIKFQYDNGDREGLYLGDKEEAEGAARHVAGRGVETKLECVAGHQSVVAKSAFGPEDIKRMERAYELALIELALTDDRNDPLIEVIAKLIIEIAQTGEKSREMICAIRGPEG